MAERTELSVDLGVRGKLFLVLASVFVTCLVVGDIIGGKLIEFSLLGYPFTLTVGMIPFPVTFLITDLLNEFYGQKAARFVTYVGFGMAVLSYGFISVAAAVPIASLTAAADWSGVNNEAFTRVFVGSQRMILASLTAYLFSQLIDIAVFHALRRLTHHRLLWLRASGSTVVSQLIDTITINSIAWAGLLGPAAILRIIVSAYVLKVLIAIGLTPLIYAGHALMERLLTAAIRTGRAETAAVPELDE